MFSYSRQKIGVGTVVCMIALLTATVTAGSASASPDHADVTLRLGDGRAAVVAAPAAVTVSASTISSWDAKLPALRRALAQGESLAGALQVAGLPALVGQPEGATLTPGDRVSPDGASCQDWTCGWEFSAISTFEIEWLVWAGTIAGPGLVCLLLGAETAGIACAVAAALWGLIASYVDIPPSYNPHRCIYIGVGWGTVAKWDKC